MQPTKYYSNVQEHRVAEYLGWKVVTGSGARDCHPGDLVSDMWLGECKTHIKSSNKIMFNRSFWDKIVKEAQSKFKFPVLIVDDGSQSLDRTWCLYPYKLVLTCDIHVCKLDIPIRSNIVFENDVMSTRYRQLQNSFESGTVVLSVEFAGTTLGIVPLNIFNDMFGE